MKKTNKTQTNAQIQKLMTYLKVSSSEEILPKISSIMEQNNLKKAVSSNAAAFFQLTKADFLGNLPFVIDKNDVSAVRIRPQSA